MGPNHRLAAATGAFLAGAAFAAWTCWPALALVERRYLIALAVAALAALGLGLLAVWVPGVAWGIGLLGAAFLIRIQLDPSVGEWTPFAAGWLLFTAEVSYWSYELDRDTRLRGTGWLPRLLQMALLALAAVAAAELVGAGSTLLPPPGPWSVVGGGVALSALLGLLLWLARRGARGAST